MMLYTVGFVVCVANILFVSGQMYVCENTIDELSCPSGQVINITNAFYGRENASICPTNETSSSAANCSLSNATKFFSSLCDGAQNCTVFFNGTASSDFCPNVTKYLSLSYKCNNMTVPELPVCGEHEHYAPILCDCLDKCQTPDFSCAPFCSLFGGCVCNRDFRRDPITKTCVVERYCPQGGDLSQTHEVFSECATNQTTCGDLDHRRPLRCEPGYQCIQGYIRNVFTSQCVRPDECTRAHPRWRK